MKSFQTRREKEIWQACDALYLVLGDEGSHAMTGSRIVAKLLALGYKKGSPNEIYRYRKSWREARGLKAPCVFQSAVLSEEPLTPEMQRMQEAIRREANAEILGVKRRYEEALNQLQDNYQATQAELLRWMAQNQELTRALQEAQQVNTSLEAGYRQLGEQNTALASQVKVLESQTQSLQATYVAFSQELKEMVKAQQEAQSAQLHTLKAAWEKDAINYKDHNENQRHGFIMDVERFRGEIRQLTEKLKVAESEKWAAQQVASLLKSRQAEEGSLMGEQLATMSGQLQGIKGGLNEVLQAMQKVPLVVEE